MLFLLSLFIIINSSQQTELMAVGLSANMTIVNGSANICNFDTCPLIICNLLANTTSAYATLYPFGGMTACPKLQSLFNVKMITFIFDKNKEMLFPISCNTMGDCLMKSCNLYLSYKESYLMAFTGQCLQ